MSFIQALFIQISPFGERLSKIIERNSMPLPKGIENITYSASSLTNPRLSSPGRWSEVGYSGHRGHSPHDHGTLLGRAWPVSENIPRASFCCESLRWMGLLLLFLLAPGYGPCFPYPTSGIWVAVLLLYPISIACPWQTLLIVRRTFSVELAGIQTLAVKYHGKWVGEQQSVHSNFLSSSILSLELWDPGNPR